MKKRKKVYIYIYACIYLLYLHISTLQLSDLVDPKLIDVLGHSAKDELEESLEFAAKEVAAEQVKESKAKMNAALDKYEKSAAVCSH